MRILLDTCVIIDWLTDTDPFDDSVWDILNDPENRLYISAETQRELIVSFNNKRFLTRFWKTYYEKNGFHYLIADERLEAKYMGIGVGRLPLNTRLMYFDLLKLNVNDN